MDLLLIALLLAAVGAVVLVALGRVGGGLAPVQPEAGPALEGPLTRPGDLDRARFTLAVRGYRMDQVDAVLDEARDLLAAKDDEIARLHLLLPAELHRADDRAVQPHSVEPRGAAADAADVSTDAPPHSPARSAEGPAGPAADPAYPSVETDPFQRREARP